MLTRYFIGLEWFGLVCLPPINTTILFVRDHARLAPALVNQYV